LLAFNLEPSAAGGGSLTGGGLATGTEQPAGEVLASAAAGVFQQVSQLLSLNSSALDLVAPLFTVSVIPGELDGVSAGEGGIALLASFVPASISTAPGQTVRSQDGSTEGESAGSGQSPAENAAGAAPDDGSPLPFWAGAAMNLEKAWEQVRSVVLE